MSDAVHHIEGDTHHLLITESAVMTTRKERFTGPTAVPEAMPDGGQVALWGPGNDHPQLVNDDIYNYPLMGGVIGKKVDMLLSGGVRYGYRNVDEATGREDYIAKNDSTVNAWLRNSRVEEQYLPEAATDWYTYENVFCELRKNKGGDKLWGIGAHDAGDVRLGVMNAKAEIDKAYIADWRGGSVETDAIALKALDPYYAVADQFVEMSAARAILPLRYLGRGQRYYGLTSWDGLRANGTVDIVKRIPQLKLLLLQNLMNLRYHIEVDERFWVTLYGEGFRKLEAKDKMEKMDAYALTLEKWLKKDGIGGAMSTTMLASTDGKDQTSMVKINEKRFVVPEGSYIEDWQELDFITCRDMGLKPSIYGISPSKSGSSPGSGSEDRVARTNHILNCRRDQAKILEPLYVARDVNGWDPDYHFWFASYHAATLDRTNQVDDKPNAGPER